MFDRQRRGREERQRLVEEAARRRFEEALSYASAWDWSEGVPVASQPTHPMFIDLNRMYSEDEVMNSTSPCYFIMPSGDLLVRFGDGEVSVLWRKDFESKTSDRGYLADPTQPRLCIKRPTNGHLTDQFHVFKDFDLYEYGKIVGKYTG